MGTQRPFCIVTKAGETVRTSILDDYQITGQSKQLESDVFAEKYELYGLQKPLYSPLVMAKLMEMNTYHMRACKVKAGDVSGQGWSLYPLVENPSEEQKTKIEEFFKKQPEPIEDTIEKAQLDKELIGYLSIEIIREYNNFSGPISLLKHIPAHTCRIHKGGNKFCQSWQGSLAVEERVWFRKLNYGKDIKKVDGTEKESGEYTKEERANEIFWNVNYTPRSCFYGIPDITPAIGAITGDISRRDYNIAFFCLSEDTEILTDSGWKLRNELGEEDRYATFNMDSESIEYQKALGIADHIFKSMISVKSSVVDILVSPDHTLIYKPPTSKSGKWIKGKFKDLIEGYQGRTIPVAGMLKGIDVGVTKEEAELIGWIITEGSIRKAGDNSKIKTFEIGQNKGLKADRIRKALETNGILFSEYENISASGKPFICFYAKVGRGIISNRDSENGRWLSGETNNSRTLEDKYIISRKNINRFLNLLEKGKEYIPDCLQIAPIPVREALFDAMIAGDGYIPLRGIGKNFVSKDKLLVDQIQRLAIGLGYRARVDKAPGDCWAMRCYKRNYTNISGAEVKEVEYNKNAWCPSVPNETIIIRRNGKACVVGNTNYGVPAYMVYITGDFDPGEEDPETKKNPLEEKITEKFKEIVKNPHSVMILAVPTKTGMGEVAVEVKPLSVEVKEASFRMYRIDNRNEIISAHGIPPYRIGVYETGELAGNLGQESTIIYNESIIKPRQKVYKNLINHYVLPSLEITDWEWELDSIDVTDVDKELDRIGVLVDKAMATPNEGIAFIGDYFGIEVKDDNPAMDLHYYNGQPIDLGGFVPASEITSVLQGMKEKLIEVFMDYVSKTSGNNVVRDRRIIKAIADLQKDSSRGNQRRK